MQTRTDRNYFLEQVDDSPEEIAFQYNFELEGKSLADSITELEDGDLLIEGYAAVFEGIDRDGENFAPGAFQRGCKSFLAHSAPLCFHHKKEMVLGKVLDLQEDGKGLKMKARIDGAIKRHPTLGVLYEQIKRGTFNGLSVQGFFRRAMQEGGPRIVDMDFTEISVTATPAHTGPRFNVVAGKALADIEFPGTAEEKEEIRAQVLEFEDEVRAAVSKLDSVVTKITQMVLKKDDKDDDEANTKDDETHDEPAADAGSEPVTP